MTSFTPASIAFLRIIADDSPSPSVKDVAREAIKDIGGGAFTLLFVPEGVKGIGAYQRLRKAGRFDGLLAKGVKGIGAYQRLRKAGRFDGLLAKDIDGMPSGGPDAPYIYVFHKADLIATGVETHKDGDDDMMRRVIDLVNEMVTTP